jgi:hypothetical protein
MSSRVGQGRFSAVEAGANHVDEAFNWQTRFKEMNHLFNRKSGLFASLRQPLNWRNFVVCHCLCT